MRVIIFSVLSDHTIEVNLLSTCADDYLSKKDFSLKRILGHVRAVLRRPDHIVGPSLTVGDLTLDVLNQRAKRGGKDIEKLNPTEFRLLEYFMRNKGLILTRPMIREHVWERDSDPFARTIETYICRLRRKIGDRESKKQLIHTVPDVGYQMDD